MLTACQSCRRYIRDTETACPFCTTRVPGGGARHAVAMMAVAALSACQGAQPDPTGANDVGPPAITVAPLVEDTPADPPAADNAPIPAATASNAPGAAPTTPPAESVANNSTPAASTTPSAAKVPSYKPRPMVMRYGMAPRLPPTSAPPTPKK